jgi:hypothetical protein
MTKRTALAAAEQALTVDVTVDGGKAVLAGRYAGG